MLEERRKQEAVLPATPLTWISPMHGNRSRSAAARSITRPLAPVAKESSIHVTRFDLVRAAIVYGADARQLQPTYGCPLNDQTAGACSRDWQHATVFN